MDQEKLTALDKKHLEGLAEIRPDAATSIGLRGHDGGLPDPSAEGRKATLDAVKAWRDERAADAAEGDREHELDQRSLDGSFDLASFCEEHLGDRDPDVLRNLTPLLAQQLLDEQDAAPRFTGLRDRLGALPEYLEQARAGDGFDPELLESARESVSGMGALCAAIATEARTASEAGDIEDSLAVDISGRVESARAALDEHDAWLKAREAKESAGAIGAEHLDHLLNLRQLELSSNEVRDLAGGMVEQMRLEAKRLAKRAFKRKPAAAMELARQQAPLSVDEVLAWASELADQARSFIVETEMFPMPTRSSLVLAVSPPGVATDLGGARLLPHTPFGNDTHAKLLVPPPATEDLTRWSVADLENLIAAYAYPGAHYLSSWFAHGPSLLRGGVPLGAWVGPATDWAIETHAGWAHHAEELMRELMFRDSPAARLVSVERALLRAVLARLDVSLHTGGVTVERARQLLTEVTGAAEAEATRLVRSVLRQPGRALSDMVGKLRVQQLRREAKIVWRQAYAEIRFHEVLLRGGPMPITHHFELIETPPVYQIDTSTISVALGDDNPYVDTADDQPVDTESAEADPKPPDESPSTGS